MKKAVVLAMLMALSVEADTMQAGKVVWQAKYQKQPVITVTVGISAETGADLIEVWVAPTATYQDFPLNSVGVNGAVVLMRVREVRPDGEDGTDNVGMREPASLFRAPKVVYGTQLKQPGGVWVFLEIRELGENYLIVVTRIIPAAPKQRTEEL